MVIVTAVITLLSFSASAHDWTLTLDCDFWAKNSVPSLQVIEFSVDDITKQNGQKKDVRRVGRVVDENSVFVGNIT